MTAPVIALDGVDLPVSARLAANDQIFAVPTLVRKLPQPTKKIIGDLANEERVLVGLNIQALDRTGRVG